MTIPTKRNSYSFGGGPTHISVRGARVHNLKNLSVEIPRDELVVITGPSGSGKSSLAFDTIYAEGQRRYVESLSSYARQFLEQMSKPDADGIDGLSPTISIEQRTTSFNPRSTVGTVTEIHDYLRLLYARLSKPTCYQCGDPIQSQSPNQMVDQILSMEEGSRFSILAPIVRGRKGEYQKELQDLRQRGFVRVRIDGEVLDLSEPIKLEKTKKHEIDVIVDRLIMKGDRSALATRVSESVDLALKLAQGQLIVSLEKPFSERLMSQHHTCLRCQIAYPPPEPRVFSFNSPSGHCLFCEGLGIDPTFEATPSEGETEDLLAPLQAEAPPCPKCLGDRLSPESLSYRLAGKNIAEASKLDLPSFKIFLGNLNLTEREAKISDRILKEIHDRIHFLIQVGVQYLTLFRSAQTLSGGEAQRIRLATQIGSALVGVIYVLDEPSIGLHPKDHEKLLTTLLHLRDLGNSVLVVEHDQETMERADTIIDLGPGAGSQGGQLMEMGPLSSFLKKGSKGLTAKYLNGELEIPVPNKRRKVDPHHILEIKGATENNLKNIDVKIPLGLLVSVTGVSGSGKSSLILDTVYPALLRNVMDAAAPTAKVRELKGHDKIDKVIDIDQSPIGKTPRSNPATYIGVFDYIRDLFAQLPEAQTRGFKPGRFSFNVKGGRCDTCEGAGLTKVEMHFLSDVYVQCEICRGRRYNRATLEIAYKGKNIAQVLEMTAADALLFFDSVPWIKAKLQTLVDVGLGYLTLGQSSTTLSGGEAQRIKLTKELSRRDTGKTFYILDEPSTGLHFEDIRKLLGILQTLVDRGNTVVIIEHNLDIIKVSDYVIDLGPEAGSQGGRLVAEGTPEEIIKVKESHTGMHLKKFVLKNKSASANDRAELGVNT